MSIEITRSRVGSKSRAQVPRLVSGAQFGVLTRLLARIDKAYIGYNLFLGYCTIHKSYYLDHIHTKGEIRCPICDRNWLLDHGFTPRH